MSGSQVLYIRPFPSSPLPLVTLFIQAALTTPALFLPPSFCLLKVCPSQAQKQICDPTLRTANDCMTCISVTQLPGYLLSLPSNLVT